MPQQPQTPESFWARVNRDGGPSSCWKFRGAPNKDGYGMCKGLRGRVELAHRIAWDIQHGAPAPGPIYQTCGNRLCCNPAHLAPAEHRAQVKVGYSSPRSKGVPLSRLVLRMPRHQWERVMAEGGEEWVLTLIRDALGPSPEHPWDP